MTTNILPPLDVIEPSPRSIFLWDEAEIDQPAASDFRPWLDPFLIPGSKAHGAVIICPGGGYQRRAPHEAGPVALQFNQAGLHAFVLHYRVAPWKHPKPLQDAARAIRIVRQHAEEWNILPNHVAILGFSAGGHLAGSLGVHFDHPALRNESLAGIACRPDAMILCYPVITSGIFAHKGSFERILGDNATIEERAELSLEKHITPQTPPAFLWHTVDDASVPVENSLLFAAGLRQNGIPFEMHLYPQGRHGLGLALEDAHIASWTGLASQWLQGMGW